jgi:uncharacterized protein involved in exopolysaccharide biosynthesis
MTDNHPDVIAAQNQIVVLRAQIRAEGPASVAMGSAQPNPAYTTLESICAERTANVQGLQARRTALQQNIAQQTSRQLDNPELVQEAQNISRDYDVLKAQYDKMLQDREELRLRGQVVTAHGGARIQVLDPPLVPRAATAPNRPLFLTVVLIAGSVRVWCGLCRGRDAVGLCHHGQAGAGDGADRAGRDFAIRVRRDKG